MLFAADRNITTTLSGGGTTLIGQAQRPKVLKWPNVDTIVAYVGQAQVGDVPADEWLYAFIGRNITFPSLDALSQRLTDELNAAMSAGDISDVMILHLGGF